LRKASERLVQFDAGSCIVGGQALMPTLERSACGVSFGGLIRRPRHGTARACGQEGECALMQPVPTALALTTLASITSGQNHHGYCRCTGPPLGEWIAEQSVPHSGDLFFCPTKR
jgi:hypothetical protein